MFEAHCAGCHGADGEGGEHGPNIVDAHHPRTRSPEGLKEIVRNGIPGTRVCPHFSFPNRTCVSYLHLSSRLTAPAMNSPVSGDIQAGEKFFFGKGGCSGCPRMTQGYRRNICSDPTSQA